MMWNMDKYEVGSIAPEEGAVYIFGKQGQTEMKVPLYYCYLSTKIHGVTSHKALILTISLTAVATVQLI